MSGGWVDQGYRMGMRRGEGRATIGWNVGGSGVEVGLGVACGLGQWKEIG